MFTIMGASSIVLANCGGSSSSPATTEADNKLDNGTSPTDTVEQRRDQEVSAESCQPEPASEDVTPHELDMLGRGPFVGTGRIWTVIPSEDWYELEVDDARSFGASLKLPWFRLGAHDLEIMMQDPEGTAPAGEVEVSPDSYPPEGVMPSTLSFDSPGCWTVRATYGSDTVEFPLWVPEV